MCKSPNIQQVRREMSVRWENNKKRSCKVAMINPGKEIKHLERKREVIISIVQYSKLKLVANVLLYKMKVGNYNIIMEMSTN